MTKAQERHTTDGRRRGKEPERSRPARTAGRALLPVLITGVLFLGTLAYGIVALPDPVAVYFWPATQPDVMYPLGIYLLQQAVLGPLAGWLLVGLAGAAWAVGEAFMPRSKAGPDHGGAKAVSALVFASALAWVTVDVWLAIGFDDKHDLMRSLGELVVALVAFCGTFAIVAVGLRQAHPRNSR